MMNSIAAELEKAHREKSIRTSVIIHLLLLLLAWLFTFQGKPPEPKKDFAVTVEFVDFKESSLSTYAHSDPGKMRPKQEQVKKVEPVKVEKIDPVVKPPVEIPKPEPVVEPQVVDPIVSEILEEDSELQAVEEEMEMEEPEPEVIEPEPELEPNDEPVFEEVPEEIVEEVEEAEEATAPVSEEAAETGDAPAAPSSLEGEEGGTGKSDNGDGAGATSGDDGDEGMGDSGDGTGEYDGSGDGIFGRRVIKRNIGEVLDNAKESGKVVAKVCINRAGIPTYAEIDEIETSITDARTLKNFLKAIQGYRYEKDGSASEEQCGRLIFNMDIDTKAKNEFIRAASGDMKRAMRSAPEMAKFKREYKGLTPQQVKNLSVAEFKKLFKK